MDWPNGTFHDAEGMDRTLEGAEWTSARRPGNLRIFTTRPDTLFGATYMVLAPEHPLVGKITTDPSSAAAVDAYVGRAAPQDDLDRRGTSKEKTGVFTGGHAINPVNGSIPIWIADYVLMGYGTGAIMAVPGTTSATGSSRRSGSDSRGRLGRRREGRSPGHSTKADRS